MSGRRALTAQGSNGPRPKRSEPASDQCVCGTNRRRSKAPPMLARSIRTSARGARSAPLLSQERTAPGAGALRIRFHVAGGPPRGEVLVCKRVHSSISQEKASKSPRRLGELSTSRTPPLVVDGRLRGHDVSGDETRWPRSSSEWLWTMSVSVARIPNPRHGREGGHPRQAAAFVMLKAREIARRCGFSGLAERAKSS